jgi:large subunit ribosomal protein L3
MLNTVLGIKQKMGAVYISDRRFPVTWVKIEPNIVTQVKLTEKNGYEAVQLGIGSKKIKNITKPLQNHLKSVVRDGKYPRYIKEVKIQKDSEIRVGDLIKLADIFKKGDVVTVTGTSKGKGFAGVVKRWHFAGGPKTHGQSDRERAPGSIGQRTTPGRVYKGKKMAGRMGTDRVTVKGLKVLDLDLDSDQIAITGAIPGKTGGLIFIQKIKESELKIEEIKPAAVRTEENEGYENETKEEVKKEVNN